MRIFPIHAVVTLCVSVVPFAWGDKKLDDVIAKADAQVDKGKEDEAIKILQKAAAQAPRDPEPKLALARLFLRLGKLDEASKALGDAGLVSGVPSSVRARVQATQSALALRGGTAADSLTLAREAVEAEAGADSLAALARAQARLGDPVARETAERAVRAAPSSAAAQIARGDALLAARILPEAEAAFQRALSFDARSGAGASLAVALAAQGKANLALEAARGAVQADTHSGEALAALALAQLAQDPLDRASEAMAAVQQGVFLEPKNPLVEFTVGRVFESRGQLADAAGAYARAAGLDPSWATPPVAALALLFRQGDATAALAGLRMLSMDLKSSGDAQWLLGRLLLRKEDWRGAKAALDVVTAAMPGVAEAQAAHGTAAYNVGELKLAANAYGRAVALEPENLTYLSNYGLFLGYDDRLDEGLAVLLKVTGRPDGQDAGAFINLGWIYRHLRPPRITEAVAAYEKALKLEPKNAKAALGVALSYRAGGQWARAVTAYERVSQVNPRLEGEALLGTSWCYFRAGDDYKARFFAGLAAKAGVDVGPLRNALLGPAKAGAATLRTADELNELALQLDEKNAGEQALAVQRLLGFGRSAVPYLASALRSKDTAIAVRETIVAGLGKMGPAARAALPELERSIKAGPRGTGSEASAAEKAREATLLGAMQAASVKIRAN
ncbi:MAG TPA: tetratricopeptide repeat protein [Vicinamibacteria bacterium]|jgi:tetratricopeptide (TPR) repeat protein|nr:tetratricopeptide repeat protein [Vicinamibacteria bacterium]